MLLIHPPVAKPCEPPAGITRLAGCLRENGFRCTVWDASLEGLLYLLAAPDTATDTWSRRARKNLGANLDALRNPELYGSRPRYRRAVADINRLLEQSGRARAISLSLANYQDPSLSPLKSEDLLRSAETPDTNIFYPLFAPRLERLLLETSPATVGLSLNYLSQAPSAFAILGYLRKRHPHLLLVLGGGLVTSWLRNPSWRDPFGGLVDHLIAGPGESQLLRLLGHKNESCRMLPDYRELQGNGYLSPGFILPYAASAGCFWKKCAFCPETAEKNPYRMLPVDQVIDDLDDLTKQTAPILLHFLDNAISPELMRSLTANGSGIQWYGFARISSLLTDADFCRMLRKSGCVMLKLGLESGNQGVLEAMNKGIGLDMVSRALATLKTAGIATYVYLLFGTPAESLAEARSTMEFIVRHHQAISFMNLAIFNLPIGSPESHTLATREFYDGDLSLYADFEHPRGWNRQQVRKFLDQEFKRQPVIKKIINRQPFLFTSNHAPFFVKPP